MKQFKAIIFDMDGVIIDSEPLWKRAEFEIFSSLGVQVEDKLAEQTQSMTTLEVTKFWYERKPWTKVSIREAEKMVVDRVVELVCQEDCGIAGVKELVEQLKQKNIKTGLATNSPAVIIPYVLKRIGLEHGFDVVLSADSVKKGKPAPDIYLQAAKQLSVNVHDCLVIEDSHSGMTAAKTAGMTVAAFTNGTTEKNFEHADFHIKSYIPLMPLDNFLL
jgi:mannitol-1-/sugar-/sorbitol-6-/2-deoxyglucose-6-phosphatase